MITDAQHHRTVAFLQRQGRSTLKEISSGADIPYEDVPRVLAELIVEGHVDLVTDTRAADGNDLFEATTTGI
jgi:hypothetical protein